MIRYFFVLFLSVLVGTTLAGSTIQAQSYPNHPIQLIISIPAKMEKRGYISDHRSSAELKKIIAADGEIARAIALKAGLSK